MQTNKSKYRLIKDGVVIFQNLDIENAIFRRDINPESEIQEQEPIRSERNRIYKETYELIKDHSFAYICGTINYTSGFKYDDKDGQLTSLQIVKHFPEIAEFKKNDAFWFNNRAERLTALFQCIQETNE
jgi:hypothetical protein